ncbi:7-cyano-7-deazaguanine synthase QueC [Nocardiopsis sp. Huas11]|uniref:7-cyano-7-deazaguanine synthase QueC n=1 Tax=Nocardiopsis sp. Huas11 TaxID=2183912 RepID=UPI001F1A4453|nr:7-cyano-7-deazaguanine synthase QueC [Nocardiopsis sp. Huas11]
MAASGGLDSTVLAYDLARSGHELALLSFDYGQRHRRELHAARRLAHRLSANHRVVDLSSLKTLFSGSALTNPDITVPAGQYTAETLRTTVVPARNAIFLSVAIGAAVSWDAQAVAFAAHSGDHQVYPDCRPAFVRAVQELARASTEGFGDVGVLAPYVTWSKAQIVEHGQRLGVPFETTWSCYQGLEWHCGTCSTCRERRSAFVSAQVPDPTEYMETAGA